MNSEIACFPPPATLGTLRKPRRRRQRGGGQTKDQVGRTPTQHVHFSNLAHFLVALYKKTCNHQNLR